MKWLARLILIEFIPTCIGLWLTLLTYGNSEEGASILDFSSWVWGNILFFGFIFLIFIIGVLFVLAFPNALDDEKKA